MEASLLAALISASSAIIVAGVSYYLTKRREREVEWRKLKLEHYQKYIAAL
jgi:putative exporter of polyketide antibiotics